MWILMFLLLATTFAVAQAQTPEELYKRLEATMVTGPGDAHRDDFSWVTPQIRAELIQYAYNTSNENLPKPQFISPQQALLYLGDPTTVAKEISDYRKADGAGSLGGPPEVIFPYLIDDLTHASSENHIGVPGSYSLMDQSLLNLFGAVAAWPSFPEATRKWAGDQFCKSNGLYYQLGPRSNGNRIMREWWEHNKEAIVSRQYDKATWLPPESEQFPDGAEATTPVESPTANQPSVKVPVSQPQAQAAKPIDTSVPFWVYGIVVFSLGLLGGVWYFLRPKN